MTDTTQEDARRCPSCNEPGLMLNRRRVDPRTGVPQGTTVELHECRNERCPDYLPPKSLANGDVMKAMRGRWAVQVNPDGTVPPKGIGSMGDKNYQGISVRSDAAQRARDQLRLQSALDERHGEAHEISRDLGYRGGY